MLWRCSSKCGLIGLLQVGLWSEIFPSHSPALSINQGSILLPLLLGFASGALSGFLVAIALGSYLYRVWTWPSLSPSASPPPSSAAHIRRLSAYVGWAFGLSPRRTFKVWSELSRPSLFGLGLWWSKSRLATFPRWSGRWLRAKFLVIQRWKKFRGSIGEDLRVRQRYLSSPLLLEGGSQEQTVSGADSRVGGAFFVAGFHGKISVETCCLEGQYSVDRGERICSWKACPGPIQTRSWFGYCRCAHPVVQGFCFLHGGFHLLHRLWYSSGEMEKSTVKFQHGVAGLLVVSMPTDLAPGGAILECFGLPIAKRDGGLLLAAPMKSVDEHALIQAFQVDAESLLGSNKLFDADLVEEDDSGAQALVGKKAKFFMVDFSWPMTLRPLSPLTRHISQMWLVFLRGYKSGQLRISGESARVAFLFSSRWAGSFAESGYSQEGESEEDDYSPAEREIGHNGSAAAASFKGRGPQLLQEFNKETHFLVPPGPKVSRLMETERRWLFGLM